MKVFKLFTVSVFALLVLTACGTTDISTPSVQEAPQIEEQSIEPETPAEPTEEELFISSLENITITFTDVPKITNINRPFVNGFTFVVKQNDEPLADYDVTISYPASKNEGVISFTELSVKTDESGKFTFTPDAPAFAADEKLKVYPTPINQDPVVFEAAYSYKAQTDWKVKSDIITKGAVLFIWDFNEKNRAINNSYDILSEFRTRGISMVGNAPVNETSYIGKPLSTLYKENYEIIENSYGYLIVGTVKFTKPVEATEDGNGYLCSLVADIQAVTMKNGKTVFTHTFEHEATGKNWNACVSKCKEELAEQIVDALVYGL